MEADVDIIRTCLHPSDPAYGCRNHIEEGSSHCYGELSRLLGLDYSKNRRSLMCAVSRSIIHGVRTGTPITWQSSAPITTERPVVHGNAGSGCFYVSHTRRASPADLPRTRPAWIICWSVHHSPRATAGQYGKLSERIDRRKGRLHMVT